ncbi:MAG: hypothetical protein CMLOHMNK_03351 [Steroidobacteraceae bacterium]|nr:hypothetical protein [Steroidobacteraceae bacterium]
MRPKNAAETLRENLRNAHWPDLLCWTGEDEIGWFSAPRTTSLVLSLLATKKVSGTKNPAMVYLELLTSHRGQGVIEMEPENKHAFRAGYIGPRAVRTWQERMRLLESLGFIQTKQIGNERYGLVAVVHPAIAVQALRDKKLVEDPWWNNYITLKAQTKEATFEALQARKGKVIRLGTRRRKTS